MPAHGGNQGRKQVGLLNQPCHAEHRDYDGESAHDKVTLAQGSRQGCCPSSQSRRAEASAGWKGPPTPLAASPDHNDHFQTTDHPDQLQHPDHPNYLDRDHDIGEVKIVISEQFCTVAAFLHCMMWMQISDTPE